MLLIANGKQRGIVLRRFQLFAVNEPEIAGAHPGHLLCEPCPIDQPIRLGIGTNESGGEEHGIKCPLHAGHARRLGRALELLGLAALDPTYAVRIHARDNHGRTSGSFPPHFVGEIGNHAKLRPLLVLGKDVALLR
jgi:hypothetical protein